jgi:hypothetical protein
MVRLLYAEDAMLLQMLHGHDSVLFLLLPALH